LQRFGKLDCVISLELVEIFIWEYVSTWKYKFYIFLNYTWMKFQLKQVTSRNDNFPSFVLIFMKQNIFKVKNKGRVWNGHQCFHLRVFNSIEVVIRRFLYLQLVKTKGCVKSVMCDMSLYITRNLHVQHHSLIILVQTTKIINSLHTTNLSMLKHS